MSGSQWGFSKAVDPGAKKNTIFMKNAIFWGLMGTFFWVFGFFGDLQRSPIGQFWKIGKKSGTHLVNADHRRPQGDLVWKRG